LSVLIIIYFKRPRPKSKDKINLFEFIIGGDGTCTPEVVPVPAAHHFDKPLELNPYDIKTFIYPNYEDTLSFVIEIGFENKKGASKIYI